VSGGWPTRPFTTILLYVRARILAHSFTKQQQRRRRSTVNVRGGRYDRRLRRRRRRGDHRATQALFNVQYASMSDDGDWWWPANGRATADHYEIINIVIGYHII